MRARAGSASRACSTAASSSSGVAALLRHPLQRGVREPLAREEDEADADADRRLDRLQADPEREAARVGHAVLLQRQRDRRLDEADVPRPEREDDRDVHQHQHEPGGRERLVDAERPHRRPDREELEQPAEVLVRRRRQRPATARASRRGPCAPNSSSMRTVPSSSSGSPVVALRAHTTANVSRPKPITNAIAMLVIAQCGSFAVKQHPDDERQRGEEVEQPVREDRADQRRPDALPLRHPPREHGDARQLAGAAGQHDVREQADAERREDAAVARRAAPAPPA